MSTDRISNLLSSIKNASTSGKEFLETVHFNQGEKILDVLEKRGLIKEVKVFKDDGTKLKGLRVDLVGVDDKIRRLEIVRLSKPGRRVYGDYGSFRKVKSGLGVLVVSTSRGMMNGEEARKKRLGGELICKAYFI